MKTKAKKTDWQTENMPEQNARFLLKRTFTPEQMNVLMQGNIPKVMEDKWFWYYEGGKLYAHRSWTGFCIYIIIFNNETGTHEVIVNRNPDQYSRVDIKEDIVVLNKLLDWWVQPQYDYYHEWLSETVDNINKQQKITKRLKIGNKSVPAVYFHKPEEPYGFLSNWYFSDFVLDGMKFTSTEQYIMYRKCMVFDDILSANAVMATTDPEKQQAIARGAKGYNNVIWSGVRQPIVMRGLMAKFSQNEDLLKALLNTQDSYLVECAKSDQVWACGISLYDDKRFDIDTWQGKNILGFALMEVRSILAGRLMDGSKSKSRIVLNKGDITRIDCDCIVNAANKSLLGGGGVDGAIHRAAGKELLEECKALHGCDTGEAKITKGYKLKAKYIIHTVGPIYSGKTSDEKLLSNCYWNSLELARKNEIHSIAFPAISTGVYGYPLNKAIPTALNTIVKWFEANRDYGITVILSCFDKNTYDMYQNFTDSMNENGSI